MAEFKVGDKVEMYEGMPYYKSYVDVCYSIKPCHAVLEHNGKVGEIIAIYDVIPKGTENTAIEVIEVVVENYANAKIVIPIKSARLYKQPTQPIKKHTILRKKYSIVGKIIY